MYKVPGVYIEEKDTLRLSVTTGATAVPAFVCAATAFGGTAPYRRFNSWLDVHAGLADEAEKLPISDSLQIYFENGGGYCYAIDVTKLEASLDQLDDVTLLVQAGHAESVAVIAAACKKYPVFGIYDADQAGGAGKPLTPPVGATDPQGAVYGPALKKGETPFFASAAVAGVYCRVDRERGVWKAPANVAIEGGYTVSPLLAEQPSDNGVNALCTFTGGAPLVWGARTLAPTGNWRFVPVRRLFNAVEKDIKKAMSVAVFEPNNAYTWEMVRGAIDNYLHQLWADGALLGETPGQAYSVLVGLGVTMTDEDLRNGQMKVKVGLAAVRPAEQIILQFSQKMNGA